MTRVDDYNELDPFTAEIGFIAPTIVCNDSFVFLNSQPITAVLNTLVYNMIVNIVMKFQHLLFAYMYSNKIYQGGDYIF